MGGVAATIAALGNGVGDGDIGIIRVGLGSETVNIRLYWDATAGIWVSRELALSITTDDGDWMSTAQVTTAPSWQYIGTKGTSTDLGKTYLRSGGIPYFAALYAAGLKLQDRVMMMCHDNGVNTIFVAPWFYEYNDGDAISFDNDNSGAAGKTWAGFAADTYGFQPSSGNIGHGVVCKSDATGVARRFVGVGSYEDNITTSGYHSVARGTHWDYVKFFTSTTPVGSALGGVPTTTPYVPAKKYLYPTLYGYGTAAASQGIADYTYEMRWTS